MPLGLDLRLARAHLLLATVASNDLRKERNCINQCARGFRKNLRDAKIGFSALPGVAGDALQIRLLGKPRTLDAAMKALRQLAHPADRHHAILGTSGSNTPDLERARARRPSYSSGG